MGMFDSNKKPRLECKYDEERYVILEGKFSTKEDDFSTLYGELKNIKIYNEIAKISQVLDVIIYIPSENYDEYKETRPGETLRIQKNFSDKVQGDVAPEKIQTIDRGFLNLLGKSAQKNQEDKYNRKSQPKCQCIILPYPCSEQEENSEKEQQIYVHVFGFAFLPNVRDWEEPVCQLRSDSFAPLSFSIPHLYGDGSTSLVEIDFAYIYPRQKKMIFSVNRSNQLTLDYDGSLLKKINREHRRRILCDIRNDHELIVIDGKKYGSGDKYDFSKFGITIEPVWPKNDNDVLPIEINEKPDVLDVNEEEKSDIHFGDSVSEEKSDIGWTQESDNNNPRLILQAIGLPKKGVTEWLLKLNGSVFIDPPENSDQTVSFKYDAEGNENKFTVSVGNDGSNNNSLIINQYDELEFQKIKVGFLPIKLLSISEKYFTALPTNECKDRLIALDNKQENVINKAIISDEKRNPGFDGIFHGAKYVNQNKENPSWKQWQLSKKDNYLFAWKENDKTWQIQQEGENEKNFHLLRWQGDGLVEIETSEIVNEDYFLVGCYLFQLHDSNAVGDALFYDNA